MNKMENRITKAYDNIVSRLAQSHQSASTIISLCDTDLSGGITQKEANACIDKYISDKQQAAEYKKKVDEHFAEADINGDGELSEGELEEEMSLAQGKVSAKNLPTRPKYSFGRLAQTEENNLY